MRRVYVTLCGRVERETDSPADVGEVVVLDVDTGKVINNISVVGTSDVVHGRTRGAQGIDWHQGEIIIGTRSSVFYHDPDTLECSHVLEEEGPSVLGDSGHQIRSIGDEIVICLTNLDRRIVVKDRKLVEDKAVPSATKQNADTLHFNAIAVSPSGEEWHVYRNKHVVCNYTTGRSVALGYNGSTHDICFLDDDHILTCNSHKGELCMLNVTTARHRVVFKKEAGSLAQPGYQEGYLRGIAYDAATKSVLVHRSSLTEPKIFILDSENFQEKEVITYPTVKAESAFDMLLDPRDWGFGYDGKSFKTGESND